VFSASKMDQSGPVDLFVSVSAGRAAFRVSDLLELSGMLASLKQEPKEGSDA
jgi:hypothetical protein